MKDQQASVLARHTGLQRQQIKGIRIAPGPSMVWPITPSTTSSRIALARIRVKVIESVTLSPAADFSTIGVGWASQIGGNPNTIWQQLLALDAGNETYQHFVDLVVSTPPAANDYLTFKIGEFLDVNQITEGIVTAGFIRAEIGWHVFDELEDLPDA